MSQTRSIDKPVGFLGLRDTIDTHEEYTMDGARISVVTNQESTSAEQVEPSRRKVDSRKSGAMVERSLALVQLGVAVHGVWHPLRWLG